MVREVKVKAGDKVSEGSAILTLESAGAGTGAAPAPAPRAPRRHPRRRARRRFRRRPSCHPSPRQSAAAPVDATAFKNAHASPSVRAFARELGVDLSRVKGSGPKDRILLEDVQKFVKGVMGGAAAAGTSAVRSARGWAVRRWGCCRGRRSTSPSSAPVESKPLSRIKKISGANLHRNWVLIPHVTNHDDADITDLEAFRVKLNKENEKSGLKVTMLAFLIKASVSALRKFPEFNASLDGDNLIYKQYYNIGFAADTPNGLVVPVIKNADQKGMLAIAKEMGELSAKAREGKLGPADMQGGCFSISSLGGIGGTYFTPIINAPEVAILGVCRSSTRPVWNGKRVHAAAHPAAVAVVGSPRDRRRVGGTLQQLPDRAARRHAASDALGRNDADHRSQGSRHRRLHRRAGDRSAGQAGRHRQGRGLAGDARVRQGDHGRTVAGRRAQSRKCGRRSATSFTKAASC